MDPITSAALIKGGSDLLGGIFGGGGQKIPETPFDLQPLRNNQLGLLNYLLGFQGDFTPYQRVEGRTGNFGPTYGQSWGPAAAPQQRPASQGGPIQRGAGQSTSGRPGMGAWTGMPNLSSGYMGLGDPRAMGGQPSMDPGRIGGARPFNGMSPMAPQGSGGFGRPMPGGFNPVNSQMGGWRDPGIMGGSGGGPLAGGMSGLYQQLGINPNSPEYQRAMEQQRQNPNAPILNFGGQSGGYGMQPGGGFNTQLPQPPSNPNSFGGRFESYFGNQLGTPTTSLQRQSLGGISQFLASNPYGQSNNALQQILGGQGYNEANQAYRGVGDANYFGKAQGVFDRLEGFNPFGAAQGSMEGILGTNPGLSGMDALRPLLERNLAAANQTGGRFGSANAILRSRAVDDNNLLAAQMYQRGVDQQIAAAGQYGMMGNSLIGARNMAGQGQLGVGQGRLDQGLGAAQGLGGLAQALAGNRLDAAGQLASNQNSMFNNLQGGYATGTAQAQQEAERAKQELAIFLGLMGQGWDASMQGRG